MQRNSKQDNKQDKRNRDIIDRMEKFASVILNCTEKKYICIDPDATKEYEYLSVGNVYHEAMFDVLGNYNQISKDCILLLVYGQPFYVKKEYLSRFDEESDETRSLIIGTQFFLN